MPRKKETNKERVERKQKEYIMAFLRTVSAVVTPMIAILSLVVGVLVLVKVYVNGY